ncbi:MAG: hypothetical protein KC619_04655 [Myxococcales bacterium]|nr:hypothetical protein [Myxococcales bacterium]
MADEGPVRPIIRRLTQLGFATSGYVTIIWAGWLFSGTELRDFWGLHLLWMLFAAIPLVLVWGLRKRSSYAHYLLIRASFGGVVFGIGWIVLMVGGGAVRRELFVWSCVLAGGGIPFGAYGYWQATRPALVEWIEGHRTGADS